MELSESKIFNNAKTPIVTDYAVLNNDLSLIGTLDGLYLLRRKHLDRTAERFLEGKILKIAVGNRFNFIILTSEEVLVFQFLPDSDIRGRPDKIFDLLLRRENLHGYQTVHSICGRFLLGGPQGVAVLQYDTPNNHALAVVESSEPVSEIYFDKNSCRIYLLREEIQGGRKISTIRSTEEAPTFCLDGKLVYNGSYRKICDTIEDDTVLYIDDQYLISRWNESIHRGSLFKRRGLGRPVTAVAPERLPVYARMMGSEFTLEHKDRVRFETRADEFFGATHLSFQEETRLIEILGACGSFRVDSITGNYYRVFGDEIPKGSYIIGPSFELEGHSISFTSFGGFIRSPGEEWSLINPKDEIGKNQGRRDLYPTTNPIKHLDGTWLIGGQNGLYNLDLKGKKCKFTTFPKYTEKILDRIDDIKPNETSTGCLFLSRGSWYTVPSSIPPGNDLPIEVGPPEQSDPRIFKWEEFLPRSIS